MPSPYPDPTPDDRDHMRRLARAVMRRVQVCPGDRDAFLEDLEQAGWVGLYQHFDSAYRWRRARDGMLDEWSLQRFGVTHRGNKDQRPREVALVPLGAWQPQQQEETARLEDRDLLARLCALLQSHGRYRGLILVLRTVADVEASPLTASERVHYGVRTAKRFYQQKQVLCRMVADLQQEAA